MKRMAVVVNPIDNVATALTSIDAGSKVEVDVGQPKSVLVKDSIGMGHKFALKKIVKGGDVVKYGEVIGRASDDIEEGKHVHVHNARSTRVFRKR